MRRLILFALLLAPVANAETGILGHWRTLAGDVIAIDRCGTSICARLVAIHPQAPGHLDANNPNPALRSRSLCNLQIGSSFRLVDPAHAEDGQLYDPRSGHTYSGSMTSDGDKLHLRGYVGIRFFGRTELWTRLPAMTIPPPCI